VPKSARPPAAPLAPVRVIPPDAILYLSELQTILHLPATCLKREVRLGRLRVARRSGRYMTIGEWVMQWVKNGEVTPKVRPASNGEAH
jgi:hypothetical protein